MSTFESAEFTIAVPEDDIADLHRRLSLTRWPRSWPEPAWLAGTDRDVLAHLVDHWANRFDWRSHERRLNAEPQRIATVSEQRVHFLHVRAEEPTGLPMILTNGWPSTFAEMIPLAHRLAGFGHDVVVPSLPGFTFSDQPAEAPAEVTTYELCTVSWPVSATPATWRTAVTSVPGSPRGSGPPTPKRLQASI